MELAKAFAGGRETDSGSIDADMRKSVLVGSIQNRCSAPGFVTHILDGSGRELSDVIRKTNFPKLYMIFAGPVPPNPSELLGGRKILKA